MIEVLHAEGFEEAGPGVVDIVDQWVQGIPPFSYSLDPSVDFVALIYVRAMAIFLIGDSNPGTPMFT